MRQLTLGALIASIAWPVQPAAAVVDRVRAVRISRPSSADHFALAEVQLWSTAGVNVALAGTAIAGSVWQGERQFYPSNLIDDVLDNPALGLWHAANGDAYPWAQITLPQDATIERVSVYGRASLSDTQSQGAMLSLLDSNGSALWTGYADSFNLTPAGPLWDLAVLIQPSALSSVQFSAVPSFSDHVRASALRITRSGPFSLGEVLLWDAGFANAALNGTATASSVWRQEARFLASFINDGYPRTVQAWYTYAAWVADAGDAVPWLHLALPQETIIKRISVVGRRFAGDQSIGATLQLLDAGGGTVWTGIIDQYNVRPDGLPLWEATVSYPSLTTTASLSKSCSVSRSASCTIAPSVTGTATHFSATFTDSSTISTGTSTNSAAPSSSSTGTGSKTPTSTATSSPTMPVCRGLPQVKSLAGQSGIAPPLSTTTSGSPGMYTSGTCESGLRAFYPGSRLLYALDLGATTQLGGTLTVTTCGHSANNTVLYAGTGCPSWDRPFGCVVGNDNSPTGSCDSNALASTVSLTAMQATYFLQLGGFNGAQVTSGLRWRYNAPPTSGSGSRSSTLSRSRSRSRSLSRSPSAPGSRSRSMHASGSKSRSRKAK